MNNDITVLYKISGTGWLNVRVDGKFVPVCKLTAKQLHGIDITLKALKELKEFNLTEKFGEV